jgi:outer membrane protein assembly factor BamC
MTHVMTQLTLAGRAAVLAACAVFALTGCESLTGPLSKKIDYKSVASAPSLEIPPDLTTPQYDDRYNVATASGIAARDATRPKSGGDIAPNANADARIARAGNERWLVARVTPEQAWNTTRQFWIENGFSLAIEQPQYGVMETDWAENRAELPPDFLRQSMGKIADVFYTTYKRDKFRSRIERGTEPGTVEIYISQRRMEQVPTTKIDNVSPAAFAWAVMPPNPGIEVEFLTRLMVKFGTADLQAVQMVQTALAPTAPEKARIDKAPDGSARLYVDDSFDRVWRRVGLALDRVGFTVVDRDRSKGLYFVRYSDPDSTVKDTGWLSKMMFWKKDEAEKPENYRIFVAETQQPPALVTVQDPNGAPDKSQNGEKILALLKDQLK